MSESEPRAESMLVVLLRALALVVATLALTYELTSGLGMFSAATGAAAGALLGGRLARSRLRLPMIWVGALAGCGFALAFRSFIVDHKLGVAILGLHGAFVVTDVVSFGLLALVVVGTLRASAARVAFLSIPELGAIAVSLASAVSAHRDGAINQPRALTDWAWTRGTDPVHVFLWVGAAAFVALFFASLRERKGRSARVLVHASALVALAGVLLFVLMRTGLPHPREQGGVLGPGASGTPQDGKAPPSKPPPSGTPSSQASSQQGQGQGQGQGGAPAGSADPAAGKAQGGKGKSSDHDQKLEFRDDYTASDDEGPVAVVLLHDDYAPPRGYYYFRQTAFSQYNGTRLVAPTTDGMDDDLLLEFPPKTMAVPGGPKPGTHRAIVHTTVALLAEHPTPFGLESAIELSPRASPDPTRFVRAYDVVSAALTVKPDALLGQKAGRAQWPPEVAAAYITMSSDLRYKVLADQIVEKSLREELRHDPFAQAVAVSAWLGKNAIYSLKSKHASAVDPTGDFLFGDMTGYCVHFAHAVAFLLRARGVPTRVAAGYAVEEGRRGNGSSIMIQAKDAHAWAEVYLENEGWIIVDVAAEHSIDPPPPQADRDLQRALGEMARGDKSAGKADESKADDDAQSLLSRVKRAALIVAALALLALYGVKLWRRLIPLVASPRHVHRLAYRAALDRISEAGWVREPNETRERFAERLRPFAPEMESLTREHLGRAFGAKTLLSAAEVLRLSRRAGNAARHAAPSWRVVLGTLNPLSWTRTR